MPSIRGGFWKVYHNSSLWSSSTAEQRHGTASELQRKWKINTRILPREGLVKGSLQYWVKQGPTDDVCGTSCCKTEVEKTNTMMCFLSWACRRFKIWNVVYRSPDVCVAQWGSKHTLSRRRPLYDVIEGKLLTAHSESLSRLKGVTTLPHIRVEAAASWFYASTHQSSRNFDPHLSGLIYYWERGQSHGATTDLKLIISKTSEIVLDNNLNMAAAACKPTQ